ncbi:MAG: Rrf2 family transcriptional regulator [Phycisphaerae bacterium]|nr:Rrf2 family transcriptional regulator [Phycisphaerae bacterium]
MYGRQSEIAIAAAARLAEVYDGGRTRLSAGAIARDRGLQAPFVAKLLTALARGGIVTSSPGPGGGYALARPPSTITIHDVVALFRREESDDQGVLDSMCRGDSACAFVKNLRAIREALHHLTRTTTLDALLHRHTTKPGPSANHGEPHAAKSVQTVRNPRVTPGPDRRPLRRR